MPKWVKKWNVPKSSGDGHWVVSVAEDGTWGCSCPVWKFKRQECKHISLIQNGGGIDKNGQANKPEYVLAMVSKPTYEERKNRLLVPLIRLPDTCMMEATICHHMLKHGYSISEIREIRRIPRDWTAEAISRHVEIHGEAEYPEDRRNR